jgi:hypothetical protein
MLTSVKIFRVSSTERVSFVRNGAVTDATLKYLTWARRRFSEVAQHAGGDPPPDDEIGTASRPSVVHTMTAMDMERLTEILEAIVDDYESQPPERRRPLLHLRAGGGVQGFNGWNDSKPAVTRDDLDYLYDSGLIELDFGSSGSYLVKPSVEGFGEVRRIPRERKRLEGSEAIDLDWKAVRPLLHAVVDVWQENGAPDGYLPFDAIAQRLDRPADDLGTVRAAELLAANDWLDVAYGDDDVPRLKPTIRGVMATRGWPGGDGEVAAERLLSALDEMAQSVDPEKRGWAARARDTLMEVGTKTLAEVVSKSVGSAV